MAESIEKLIIKNVDGVLTALVTSGVLKRFVAGTFLPEDGARPACGMMPNDEDVTRGGSKYGANDQLLSLKLSLVVDEGNEKPLYELLDLIYEIDKALMVSKTRAGLAVTTRKLARRFLFLDPVTPMAGADVDYGIVYSSDIRDPAVKV